LPAQKFEIGARVDVGEDGFVVDLRLDDAGSRLQQTPRAPIAAKRRNRWKQFARKQRRIAAFAVTDGNDRGAAGRSFEGLDQGVEKARRNARHVAEKHERA
jgi:hypothetical protein